MWFTEKKNKNTENDKRATSAKVCILSALSPERAEVFLWEPSGIWSIIKLPAAQVV